MGRAILSWLTISMLLLTVGCTSRVNVDYDQAVDFGKLGSYRQITKSDTSSSDTRLNSPLIDKRIARYLEEDLAAKGFVLAQQQADFAVIFQLNLKHEIVSDASGVSMVFGSGFGRGGFGMGYSVPAVEVESEEWCMLTIDIVDAANKELLWRGTSSRRLVRGGTTPAKADAFFETLVAEIMAHFPPR